MKSGANVHGHSRRMYSNDFLGEFIPVWSETSLCDISQRHLCPSKDQHLCKDFSFTAIIMFNNWVNKTKAYKKNGSLSASAALSVCLVNAYILTQSSRMVSAVNKQRAGCARWVVGCLQKLPPHHLSGWSGLLFFSKGES